MVRNEASCCLLVEITISPRSPFLFVRGLRERRCSQMLRNFFFPNVETAVCWNWEWTQQQCLKERPLLCMFGWKVSCKLLKITGKEKTLYFVFIFCLFNKVQTHHHWHWSCVKYGVTQITQISKDRLTLFCIYIHPFTLLWITTLAVSILLFAFTVGISIDYFTNVRSRTPKICCGNFSHLY